MIIMSKKQKKEKFELLDARDRINEVIAMLEKIIKEHKTLDQRTIEAHKEKLLGNIEEASEFINKNFKEVLKDLEKHKKRISSIHKFIKRHYKI